MTLHTEVRAALARAAEDLQAPDVDATAVLAAARARRRSRRRTMTGVAVSLLLMAIVLVAAELGTARRHQAVVPASSPSAGPGSLWPTAIPYCRPRAGSVGDLLHVDGQDLELGCSAVRHGRYLYTQSGTTVLEQAGVVYVQRARSWVDVGRVSGPAVKLSEDGRYVSWIGANPAGFTQPQSLWVVAVDTGESARSVEVPDVTVTHIIGTDDRGRTYLGAEDGSVVAYDIPRHRWLAVTGIPVEDPEVTYVTADGFGVLLDGAATGSADRGTVEGRVSDGGRFEPVRTVPLGRGVVWSDDRRWVAEATAGEVWVRSTDDLSAGVRLDVGRRAGPEGSVIFDASWDDARTVYVDFTPLPQMPSDDADRANDIMRCDLGDGSCEPVEGIELPMGPNVPQLA